MRKTAEDHKNDILQTLVEARQQIFQSIQKLHPEQVDQPFLGYWTVKDLVAHLIGWDFTNLQSIQEILKGQYPSFFQYYDKDWHTYNDRLVLEHKREPFEALLEAATESHRQLMDFLVALPAKELINAQARSPSRRTISARFLLSAESGDERKHAGQILAFAENQDP